MHFVEQGASLLEVGCSSGFYSEIIDHSGLPITYSGCDYSESFISLAKEKYPSIDFSVDEATDLHYPDNSFDIVLSGCCLLHIPQYAKATVRKQCELLAVVIFSSDTRSLGSTSAKLSKTSLWYYETIEIHFNESFSSLVKFEWS